MPSGSTGECTRPGGYYGERKSIPWTPDSWEKSRVDFTHFDKCIDAETGAETLCAPFCAQLRPSQPIVPGGAAPVYFRGKVDKVNGQWPQDACKYCANRPVATGQDANPNNPDFWKFGTGNGAHPPHACYRLKRAIAEGGNATDPHVKSWIQDGLYYLNLNR